MAVTYKDLVAPQQCSTSTDTKYTAGTSERAVIIAATVTNTTAGAVTLRIYLVPTGGTANDTTTIYYVKSIPVSADPLVLDGLIGKVIEAGGTIQTLASANTSLTLHISGVVFS
jgi:hypothetical protein